MNKHGFFILIIILMVGCGGGGSDGSAPANVNSVPSVWYATDGTSIECSGKSVKQTSDGGYIVVGSVATNGSDVLLIKYDSNGNKLWDKSFGDTGYDHGRSVQQTTGGGYIILGDFMVGSQRQMWLIKTDSEGNRLWDRLFGFTNSHETGAEVQQTSDGGYILIGTSEYSDGSGAQVYIVKTDADGNTQWYQEKGYSDSNERGASIQQTTDGGYIFTGITYQFDSEGDVWLVKIGANGSTTWHEHTGYPNSYDEGTSIRQTRDGGYIIAANAVDSGDVFIGLLKTDSMGNWQNAGAYGGPQLDYNAKVEQTEDGGYIIAGSTYSYGAGQSDGWLIKVDANLKTLWTSAFGGSGQDYFYSVQQTSDGGYIMVGSTESYGEGSTSVYLFKTDANGSSLP